MAIYNINGNELSSIYDIYGNALERAYDASGNEIYSSRSLTGISVVYSGGNVPAGTTLDQLTGITVTATYSDGTSEVVTDYTISGTLTAGQDNTITVTYQGKAATFQVTVEQVTPTGATLADYKWVAFGDSLTDPTASGGKYKYHYWINRLTGMEVSVHGKGGTGHWSTKDSGTCYYQRMSSIPTDADIITIFGSVNDHKMQVGPRTSPSGYAATMGFDTDGIERTWNELYNTVSKTSVWYSSSPLVNTKDNPEILDSLTYADTITGGQASYVAYVNEAVNIAHSRCPQAKIVLVHEIHYKGIHDDMCRMQRMVKKRLVEKRIANGDIWLSLYELDTSTYDGILGSNNAYYDTQSGQGMSFTQIELSTFGRRYAADYSSGNFGHPNAQYNFEWIAPQFAQLLCDTLGVDRSTLPTREDVVARMEAGEFTEQGVAVPEYKS